MKPDHGTIDRGELAAFSSVACLILNLDETVGQRVKAHDAHLDD
jgi:hypothetical protein